MTERPPDWCQQFPDLYSPLDDEQREILDQMLSSQRLEGLVPDREMVADLTALIRSQITGEEYRVRSSEWARNPRQPTDDRSAHDTP